MNLDDPYRPRISLSLDTLRQRLTDRRFWIVQLGVVALAVAHIVAEVLDSQGNLPAFLEGAGHFPVEAYVVPVILAGVWLGFEGGFFTALETLLLSTPNLILFHHTDYAWLGELSASIFVVVIGVIVARMVEYEQHSRRRAEATSRRLESLRLLGLSLAQARDSSTYAAALLEHITRLPRFDGAAFVPSSELPGVPAAVEGTSSARAAIAQAIEARTIEPGPSFWHDQGMVVLDLEVHGIRTGRLYVAIAESATPSEADLVFLQLVAVEAAVALDGLRMHEAERDLLEDYARTITEAQEEERKRIARDIHDDSLQSLVVIARGLDRVAAQAVSNETRRRLDRLAADTRRVLTSLRRTSRALRPAMLDELGLLPALESIVNQSSNGEAPPRIELSVRGTPRRLEPETEIAAFRVAQEALNNVRVHSRATDARVEVDFGEDGGVVLRVIDNGRGFPLDKAQPTNAGLGLVGMRERAQLVGGTVTVESAPGSGTTVTLTIDGG